MAPSSAPITLGRLTHGPQPNALAVATTAFVYKQLKAWRDRPGRPIETDEERLNAQLTRHLNGSARHEGFPAIFQHEEKQTGRRRVDIAASPVDMQGTIVGSLYIGFDEPFLVLEGKRLPSPGGKDRKREYVTGEPDVTGGIQRFKLGLHGAKLSAAVIIGYLQHDSAPQWHRRINGWIGALARSKSSAALWSATETLGTLTSNSDGLARCTSNHFRQSGASANIHLDHLWIEMSG